VELLDSAGAFLACCLPYSSQVAHITLETWQNSVKLQGNTKSRDAYGGRSYGFEEVHLKFNQ
jgi:hypothetical protein